MASRSRWFKKSMMTACVMAMVALPACSSSDTSNEATTSTSTSTTSSTTTQPESTEAPATATVLEIAERLRDAANRRDAVAVADLAPTTSQDTREFFIGGSPYETVNCYVWEGRDECSVINGIADFAFVVDAAAGLVTEITYVGGA